MKQSLIQKDRGDRTDSLLGQDICKTWALTKCPADIDHLENQLGLKFEPLSNA